MLLSKASRTFLKHSYPGIMNGVQIFSHDILKSSYYDDVQRGLRSGAMSQQTFPVFITETTNLHLSPNVSACTAAFDLQSVRAGSALAMDSQGNVVAVERQSEDLAPGSHRRTGQDIGKGLGKHDRKSKRNRLFSEILRADLASEAAAVRMFAMQSKAGGQRPDLQYFQATSIVQSPAATTHNS